MSEREVVSIVDAAGQKSLRWWCPGCRDTHEVVDGRWTWNGSSAAPTFSPSVLVMSGHYSSRHDPGVGCWCTWEAADGEQSFRCNRCHCYVRDGRIEFLTDCTHELGGTTVPMGPKP